MEKTMKHYQVVYQLFKSDGLPNGVPCKYPIRTTSKEEAVKKCLQGHQSSECKILDVIEDGE